MRTIIPKDAILVPEHATEVFAGEIYKTYQWEEKMLGGSFATYEMLKRCDSVQVFMIEDNQILVQNQEQPHVGSFMSFPGGRHDVEEETELEAAKRELLEESGYTCKNWKLFSATQGHSKIDHIVYTFIASDIESHIVQSLDAGEKIENIWVDIQELKDCIYSGKFRGSFSQVFEKLTEINDLLNTSAYKV